MDLWGSETTPFRFNFGSENPPATNDSCALPVEEQPALPCREVFAAEASGHELGFAAEELSLPEWDGVVLLKGRVVSEPVLAKIVGDAQTAAASDLVAGRYEGGFKLWECALDLVSYLCKLPQEQGLRDRRVLELGCGHGLPGAFAATHGGASCVHLQDYNVDVLTSLTIPTLQQNLAHVGRAGGSIDVRYFAGDWDALGSVLPLSSGTSKAGGGGYDVILSAECIYSMATLAKLFRLIKASLARPHGVAYVAAKTYYFGVGGGTRQFEALVRSDADPPTMLVDVVATYADGSSNMREILRLRWA